MMMVAHRRGGRIRWGKDVPARANIFSMMPDRERVHPNEKPLPLMRAIVETHSHDRDVILDPFMGSGTTGVACVQLGRGFIGIELDPGYFDIAVRRISDELKRPRLALPEPAPQMQQQTMDI